MDARKKIEHEIESKAKASLKEGLGQELKTVRTRNLIIFFYLFGFNPFFCTFCYESHHHFFGHEVCGDGVYGVNIDSGMEFVDMTIFWACFWLL